MSFPIYFPKRRSERGNTEAALTALNEVLLTKEWCIETDTGRAKIGDGVTAWNDLPYANLGAIDFTGLSGGNVPTYDAGDGVFKMATPSGGGGGSFANAKTIATALHSTTASFPLDSTRPDIGDGAYHYAEADTTITPNSASTQIKVDCDISYISPNSTCHCTVALFRDSDPAAIAVWFSAIIGASAQPVHLSAIVPSNAASPTTFKLYLGVQAGTGYTLYILSIGGTGFMAGDVTMIAQEVP